MRRAALAALLVLTPFLGAGVAKAKPAVLTADQMLDFGASALTKGYAEQALSIAEALLTRNPVDSSALVLKAQSLRVLHRYPESEAAARAAWAAAKDPAQQYAAAMAVAQALSLQNHRTLAQFWLRQAVQDAPSDAAQKQAMQDFAYVRSQNPLTLQIDASIQPSDNVNGGARDPLFEYQGIPFILSGDALALSGLAWGVGLQGQYKLTETETVQNSLIFGVSDQGVILSQAAEAQAPQAKNGDYALQHVSLGFEHRVFGAKSTLTTAIIAGHTWYGGRDLANGLAVSANLALPWGKGIITYSANLAQQNRLDHSISSSTEGDLGAVYDIAGPKGDQWQAILNFSQMYSQDISIDHAEATASLGWTSGKPMAGFTPGAVLSVRGADYSASPYTMTGRQDTRWVASVNATINQMTYLGFAPFISLDYSRNVSNVSLYDTESLGVSVSVKSRF